MIQSKKFDKVEYMKAYREKNREKARLVSKKYYEDKIKNNKEKIKQRSEYNKQYFLKNKKMIYCEHCKREYNIKGINAHRKTKKHIKNAGLIIEK